MKTADKKEQVAVTVTAYWEEWVENGHHTCTLYAYGVWAIAWVNGSNACAWTVAHSCVKRGTVALRKGYASKSQAKRAAEAALRREAKKL